jgi:hypothetical protein
MATRIGSAVVVLVLSLLLGMGLASSAKAQCTGEEAVEDFATNMKGCAGSVTFANRGSLCAPGWGACSAAQWVARFGGKIPSYNYWTNDNLRFASDEIGCSVRTVGGEDCGSTPMRVCSASVADHDGAYQSMTRLYLLQTFPTADITLVTSLDRTTLATQTFAGVFTGETFNGTHLGGPGSLTLTFTATNSGTDGTETFSRLTGNAFVPDPNFDKTEDPLGNECNWHRCGLNASTPVQYFGGCEGNTTAGTLCCQLLVVDER